MIDSTIQLNHYLVSRKVHITNKTQELLKKRYSIKQTTKGDTVPQFKQNNLQTFLVSPVSIEYLIKFKYLHKKISKVNEANSLLIINYQWDVVQRVLGI